MSSFATQHTVPSSILAVCAIIIFAIHYYIHTSPHSKRESMMSPPIVIMITMCGWRRKYVCDHLFLIRAARDQRSRNRRCNEIARAALHKTIRLINRRERMYMCERCARCFGESRRDWKVVIAATKYPDSVFCKNNILYFTYIRELNGLVPYGFIV